MYYYTMRRSYRGESGSRGPVSLPGPGSSYINTVVNPLAPDAASPTCLRETTPPPTRPIPSKPSSTGRPAPFILPSNNAT